MATTRKVTVELPGDLLRDAQKSTGAGVTETIREGLRLVAAAKAFDDLRAMRGKLKLKLDLSEMRRDRR